MHFSLVLPTIGKTDELKRFLEHLDNQTYRDFDLTVVGQSSDDRFKSLLQSYKDRFPLYHVSSAIQGASRARNVGLKQVGGEIITFPDDDCWYPPKLLELVNRSFHQNPNVHILTGRSIDAEREHSHAQWDLEKGFVNRFNVWKRAIEFSIFIRRQVVEQVGFFDEALGVGAETPWGSGEGTDYLLRTLNKGFRIHYDPSIVIYHPQPVKRYNEKAFERARSYGRGSGRVLRKHHYPFWFVGKELIRSIAGAILSLSIGKFNKARFYLAAFQGKFTGWIAKPRAES